MATHPRAGGAGVGADPTAAAALAGAAPATLDARAILSRVASSATPDLTPALAGAVPATLDARAILSRAASSATPDLTPAPLRPAGVLIAIYQDAPRVILTKRASGLRHHPGQIALPGGKVDPGDDGPVAAALRESHEEVGLPPEAVTILGTLPAHQTVTGFSITPVVGLIHGAFTPVPEAGEVDEVFDVPLPYLADPAHYRVEGRIWRGVRRSYYVVPYGPYYIWGATARILRGLAMSMMR